MQTNLLWFRQDLRLHDNPALHAALSNNSRIIPIFIIDTSTPPQFELGAASKWWLHHSLIDLNNNLDNKLQIYKGDAKDIILKLAETENITHVFWNRCYDSWSIQRDSAIKTLLKKQNIAATSYNGSLLWEPWDITKKDGSYYKVFTPFYKNGCLNGIEPRKPLKSIIFKEHDERIYKPKNNKFNNIIFENITQLGLIPEIPWYSTIESIWQPGEKQAKQYLKQFLEHKINNYKELRNYPEKENTSKLSPFLHFGEISINTIWHAALTHDCSNNPIAREGRDCFLSELGWREFSYYLLYHFPELYSKNFQNKFDNFPWKHNQKYVQKALQAWQKGLTGYPIVDAGMRELWQTGYMHNRIRMVVASFLVKNLQIHWHHGANWFWDCLLDADLASNSASWQWVAGSGADAAPYFRIFNPITQGEKFDPDGSYTKYYIPELKNLPNKYLYCPWEAPIEVLNAAGVILGKTYPKPIVDLKTSREQALLAYKRL